MRSGTNPWIIRNKRQERESPQVDFAWATFDEQSNNPKFPRYTYLLPECDLVSAHISPPHRSNYLPPTVLITRIFVVRMLQNAQDQQ